MSIPPMDISQMKQVTRRVNGSLPTDLSKVEGDRIIKHPSVTGELAHFWFRVRNVAREPATKFAVYIDSDTMKHIHDEGILFLNRTGDDELEALVKQYTDNAWERAEVLEVLEISGKFSCREEVAKIVNEQCYIPASFDELIAFAWQHDHFFTTQGHCFVHVLEPTTRARMPLVWHDNDPRGGYPQLNLSFDDVDDGMLNQASCSSILVLVKKKEHQILPPDECNKAVRALEARVAEDAALMKEMGTQIHESGQVLEEAQESLESTIAGQATALAAVQAYARLIRKLIDNPFLRFLPGITTWLEELGKNEAIRKCLDEFVPPK
ncbi:MAG TPA: hypothetical protein VKP88_04010 [Candidatus Paceibacterota bacterium]|nr:hypothetical protein [Candidatus Paceibacterota bacterium]